MKYITLFETTEAYNAATLDLPNVSLVEENMSVNYNPWVEPETRVVCKYNVTSTSEPTTLRTSYEDNIFKSMEIDGVILDELVTEYTFGTTGVHTVKYELYDETKLGNQAPVFMNGNLIEIIIPDNVTSIGENAFVGCSGLTNVTIGNGITSIVQVFTNCSNLTNVTIGNSVTSIGLNAFNNCTSFTSITIPDSVTSIGQCAFMDCTSLTNVTIPNSVTSIVNAAFFRCTSLTSVTIGNGVTSIGASAFEGCNNLTSIVSNAMTAPTITNTVFKDINTDGTLTVPVDSTGYDAWMHTDDYYLGKYNWTKVEQ